MKARAAFGLVELIVAMTLLAVGVLGLAAVALVAHRSFATADALERTGMAAAAVIDSLLREPAPVAGERTVYDARVHWTVNADRESSGAIDVTVEVTDGARRHSTRFHAFHDRLYAPAPH